jgi:hypothetical protein
MRYRIPLILAAVAALAACEGIDPMAPSGKPEFLLGSSPLLPLLHDPLEADLLTWTNPKTREVSYAVTMQVTAREDLFEESADPTLRFVGSVVFRNAAGKTVAAPKAKTVAASTLDPVASGTDGYALVVIALVLSGQEAQALTAALARGDVYMQVTTDVVATAQDGSDDIMDSLGGLLLADPRPSPLPFPPEWM